MRDGVTKLKTTYRVDVQEGKASKCLGVFKTLAEANAALYEYRSLQHRIRNRTDVR
jgi:hypothetical protein